MQSEGTIFGVIVGGEKGKILNSGFISGTYMNIINTKDNSVYFYDNNNVEHYISKSIVRNIISNSTFYSYNKYLAAYNKLQATIQDLSFNVVVVEFNDGTVEKFYNTFGFEFTQNDWVIVNQLVLPENKILTYIINGDYVKEVTVIGDNEQLNYIFKNFVFNENLFNNFVSVELDKLPKPQDDYESFNGYIDEENDTQFVKYFKYYLAKHGVDFLVFVSALGLNIYNIDDKYQDKFDELSKSIKNLFNDDNKNEKDTKENN